MNYTILPLPLSDRRNLATVHRLMVEIEKQSLFLQRNGDGDQLRWQLIALNAKAIVRVARLGCRRYEKATGFKVTI